MRKRLILALALVAALSLSLVVATGGSAATSGGKAKGKRGAALMRATTGNAVVGTSLLRYRGKNGGTLKGWVVVTGLVPDSTHAWHLHGHVKGDDVAPGNCKTQDDGVVVAFDDFTANAMGVAIIRVNVKGIGKNPLRRGNYINIHEFASDGDPAVGPGIVCGMIKNAVV